MLKISFVLCVCVCVVEKGFMDVKDLKKRIFVLIL